MGFFLLETYFFNKTLAQGTNLKFIKNENDSKLLLVVDFIIQNMCLMISLLSGDNISHLHRVESELDNGSLQIINVL